MDSIDATLAEAAAHSGAVVAAPHPDCPGSASPIATFRDPAGNVIGRYQESTDWRSEDGAVHHTTS